MKTVKVFMMSFFVLAIILAITALQAPVKVLAQEPATLLFDDFDGNSLDPALWFFTTNSAGAYWQVNNGILTIHGGNTAGGGGIVGSANTFTAESETLVLEISAKVDPADGAFWGFHQIYAHPHAAVGFGVNRETHVTQADTVYEGCPITDTPLSHIDATTWHLYRIELDEAGARFYVDDQLEASHTNSCEPLASFPMNIRLDKHSLGQDRTLLVDFVRLTSRPRIVTPTATPTPVPYNFSGFFPPIDNLPVLNVVKAGRAVPVKFSLGEDQGLNIFDVGYPQSQEITCDSSTLLDDIEETVSAGESTLSYNPETDQYSYIWKTNETWSNTCRQLIVKLSDGTYHRANFKFK